MIITFQCFSGVPRPPSPDTNNYMISLYLIEFLDECQEIRELLNKKKDIYSSFLR